MTGVGAPSYVSGAHVWNGTALTLNAKPTMTNTTPITSMPPSLPLPVTTWPMAVSLVLPVAPYSRLIPYSITALANTPSKKYLTPASLLLRSRLRHAAIMYAGIDRNSRAMKTLIKSRADAIITMPKMLLSSIT